jgi:hypothetical protein
MVCRAGDSAVGGQDGASRTTFLKKWCKVARGKIRADLSQPWKEQNDAGATEGMLQKMLHGVARPQPLLTILPPTTLSTL